MATTATKSRRANTLSPYDEIVAALDEIAEKMKDTALLIAEYATQFNGQNKSEMDSSCASLRSLRRRVVSAKMLVADAEDSK